MFRLYRASINSMMTELPVIQGGPFSVKHQLGCDQGICIAFPQSQPSKIAQLRIDGTVTQSRLSSVNQSG
jgi:hypothetical protein